MFRKVIMASVLLVFLYVTSFAAFVSRGLGIGEKYGFKHAYHLVDPVSDEAMRNRQRLTIFYYPLICVLEDFGGPVPITVCDGLMGP